MVKDYQKIDVWFLVFVLRSYMISLVSYKDRTKKSSVESMKSFMILLWNQRNFNPGLQRISSHYYVRFLRWIFWKLSAFQRISYKIFGNFLDSWMLICCKTYVGRKNTPFEVWAVKMRWKCQERWNSDTKNGIAEMLLKTHWDAE